MPSVPKAGRIDSLAFATPTAFPAAHWSLPVLGSTRPTLHIHVGTDGYRPLQAPLFTNSSVTMAKHCIGLSAAREGRAVVVKVWAKGEDDTIELLSRISLPTMACQPGTFDDVLALLVRGGTVTQETVDATIANCVEVDATLSNNAIPIGIPIVEDLSDSTLIPLMPASKVATGRFGLAVKTDPRPRAPVPLPAKLLGGLQRVVQSVYYVGLSTDGSLLIWRMAAKGCHPKNFGGRFLSFAAIKKFGRATTVPVSFVEVMHQFYEVTATGTRGDGAGPAWTRLLACVKAACPKRDIPWEEQRSPSIVSGQVSALMAAHPHRKLKENVATELFEVARSHHCESVSHATGNGDTLGRIPTDHPLPWLSREVGTRGVSRSQVHQGEDRIEQHDHCLTEDLGRLDGRGG